MHHTTYYAPSVRNWHHKQPNHPSFGLEGPGVRIAALQGPRLKHRKLEAFGKFELSHQLGFQVEGSVLRD